MHPPPFSQHHNLHYISKPKNALNQVQIKIAGSQSQDSKY